MKNGNTGQRLLRQYAQHWKNNYQSKGESYARCRFSPDDDGSSSRSSAFSLRPGALGTDVHQVPQDGIMAQSREEKRLYVQEYRRRFPEKVRASLKRYDVEHKAERQAYQKQYRLTHQEENRAYQVQYRQEHKEERRVYTEKRRAWKRAAAVNDFTAAQWRALQQAFNHCCAYCGIRAYGRLTQEHITPLSKGGNNTLANIVPACSRCNSKKRAGSPFIPVQPLLLISEETPRYKWRKIRFILGESRLDRTLRILTERMKYLKRKGI